MAEDEPTWAVVLHALYEKGMTGASFDECGYSELARKGVIANELDRDQAEVSRSIQEMIDTDLINEIPTGRESRVYIPHQYRDFRSES